MKTAFDRSQISRLIELAITYTLCAWLAFNFYETIGRLSAYQVALPFGDYWRVAQHFRDYQSGHLNVFWRPHNEHRIIFPEIVYAFDMLFVRGRTVLPMIISFIAYGLTFGVFANTVLRDDTLPLAKRIDVTLLGAVLVFWQGVALAIADPFLLQWTLMQLAVALALLFLVKRNLFATIVAGVVATFSSANALVLWPLLLALALLARVPRRFFVSLAIAAALSVGLFFVGYHVESHANWGALFTHFGYFISFAASYIAMPFSAIKSAAFGIGVGVVCLAVGAVLLTLFWRRGLFQTQTGFILSGYYLFTLLTIVITAAGRMDLADKSVAAARVTRYLTVPFLNWGAFLLLCLWMSARLNWRVVTTKRLTVVLGGLLLLGTHKLSSWQLSSANEFSNAQLAAESLDVGLTDAQLIRRIFPDPQFVHTFLPELKKQKRGVFHYQHEKWLGSPLTAFGLVLDDELQGQIISAEPVEHGLEVVGWVNSPDARDRWPRILLVNEEKKVVGFGRRPPAGFPSDLITAKTPEEESWIAFANTAIPSRTISAYAVTHKGLAPIPGAAIVPGFTGASREEAGAPVPDISWTLQGAWGLNGIPVSPIYGWLPTSPAYSSHQGRDQNTGEIAGAFATPQNHCVILPILHGPSVGGASAQLVDADTGSVLAHFPFRDHDNLWSLWRVPLRPDIKRLKYIATDNGAGWGQWLAVSAPVECQ